jgi:hypothetical protein
MTHIVTLLTCGFVLSLVVESSVLSAQTDNGKPASKVSESPIETCTSLKNPVLGGSLADASRRIQAWKNCVAKRASEAEAKKSGVRTEKMALEPKAKPKEVEVKKLDRWPSAVNANGNSSASGCNTLQGLIDGGTRCVEENMKAEVKAAEDKVAADAEALRRQEVVPMPQDGQTHVRLIGTAGLPFMGACYAYNSAGIAPMKLDGRVPCEYVIRDADHVSCNAMRTSHRLSGNMVMQVIKDGKVLGRSETDDIIGTVEVVVDIPK